MDDRHLMFYRELMGSLCLTMMYDIFEPHAQRDASDTHTDRTAYIVKQLMDLLSTGISRTEREVSYYAERLHVSPKYLSATVKRVTGHSVSSYINRATVPIIKKYLDDERLSLTQISELWSAVWGTAAARKTSVSKIRHYLLILNQKGNGMGFLSVPCLCQTDRRTSIVHSS